MKVNDLTSGVTSSSIKNDAIVDDKQTNEVTHEVEDNRKPSVGINKRSNPSSGSNVSEGEKITYYIDVENRGDGKFVNALEIKDTIPTGTTYVPNSAKIEQGTGTNASLNGSLLTWRFANGLDSGQKIVVSFEVTVNSLASGTTSLTLRNKATVNSTDTNEVVHNVVKSDLKINKRANPESNSKVDSGSKITYYVDVENKGTGDYKESIVIKDTIPTGTTYVANSAKVDLGSNGTVSANGSALTWTFPNGLTKGGKITVSFEVTVGDVPAGQTIKNVATVNDTKTPEVTHTVTNPNIKINKASDPSSGSNINEGDTVTYYIDVESNGDADYKKQITIKDTIPDGTTYIANSAKVEQGANVAPTFNNSTLLGHFMMGLKKARKLKFHLQ